MVVNGTSVLQIELYNSPVKCHARPPRSRESNDPFEVKRCHYMKSLRNILSSSCSGERGKCATNWIAQLTCQVPRPPRSRESNDPFEVKRCHCMKSLRNILFSSYGGERGKCATNWMYNSPVKCHALQGHVNPMTLMKWKGVTSLHEKLKDHQVLKQGKCATNWIVLLTCQVPPRESYDSRCTAWKVQGTSCLQPALMHGMTGCKFNMLVQLQCCTLQFTTRLGHMVLDQYSLT